MINKINLSNQHQKSFSFVVMDDNRDGDNILKKIISNINKDKDVSFVLNNGDLVPDIYKQEFSIYLGVYRINLTKQTAKIG